MAGCGGGNLHHHRVDQPLDSAPTIGSGIAAIPLLMVKPWSVWPKLLERPFIGTLTRQRKRASFVVLPRSGWLIESPGMGFSQGISVSGKHGPHGGYVVPDGERFVSAEHFDEVVGAPCQVGEPMMSTVD